MSVVKLAVDDLLRKARYDIGTETFLAARGPLPSLTAAMAARKVEQANRALERLARTKGKDLSPEERRRLIQQAKAPSRGRVAGGALLGGSAGATIGRFFGGSRGGGIGALVGAGLGAALARRQVKKREEVLNRILQQQGHV